LTTRSRVRTLAIVIKDKRALAEIWGVHAG
jgi:hypothetical protein